MAKSIMQKNKECYLCRKQAARSGYYGPLSTAGLEQHHIMHGTANRKISEKYALKVWLCIRHHREGPEAVHVNRNIDLELIKDGQRKFEELHSRDEWMSAFMKNYL